MVDALLKQLGVNHNRKKGVFNNFMSPYKPRDYRGIVEEWKKIHGLGDKNEE